MSVAGVGGRCHDEPVLTVTAAQRRARLVRRHVLTPAARSTATVVEVVEALTCLHATEPATVHLSVAARSLVDRAAVDQALYVDRTVVKQLAMRRTLCACPVDLLPHVWVSASARVAAQLSARLAGEVESNGLATDGAHWVGEAGAAVLEVAFDELVGAELGGEVVDRGDDETEHDYAADGVGEDETPANVAVWVEIAEADGEDGYVAEVELVKFSWPAFHV